MRLILGIGLVAFCCVAAYGYPEAKEPDSSLACTTSWSGPSILLGGNVLPLPRGYSLVDRTAEPHEFTYSGIPSGQPPGRIAVGRADNFVAETLAHAAAVVFHVSEARWRGIRRISLVHRELSSRIEIFEFPDGIVLALYGSAVDFSEDLARCYAILLEGS